MPCTLDQYISALKRLEKILPVWPGLTESLIASHDYNAIMLYDCIALEFTKTSRPITRVLSAKEDHNLPQALKREGSRSNDHMRIPWDRKMPGDLEVIGGYRWMIQSYVPEWRQVGQWRCIMVDMAPCYIIHDHARNPGSVTRSSSVSACLREDGWTLKELTR